MTRPEHPGTAPAISVVVPTRGGATRLPALMEALAAQVVDEPWEVVVVLDGNVDDSETVIAAYADRLPLRFVRRAGGQGVSAALAEGYSEARGDVVLRCDDDLTPSPHLVAGHLAHHHARPVGDPPLGVISLTRDVFDDTPYAAAYGRPSNARLRAAAYRRPADDRWRHWAACNSVSRSAYLAAGGFDPTMVYREDSELGLRLMKSGVEIVIDPVLEVEHRGPASDTRTRAARAFTSGASMKAFAERHPGTHDTQAPAGPWGRIVSAAANRISSRQKAAVWGRRVDSLLPRLPQTARGKCVALVVEAAALAGSQTDDTTWVRSGGASSGLDAALGGAVDVAVFVPGLAAGGGAEKTALVTACTLAGAGLSVACFTDSDVSRSWLESHFGFSLGGVEIRPLPSPRLPRRTPRAVQDLARDVQHIRAVRAVSPRLFVNMKFKSELPGPAPTNWYYVHFPHSTNHPTRSCAHATYLALVAEVRRAVVLRGARRFIDTYQVVLANSDFTSGHVRRRWGVMATTAYPPSAPVYEQPSGERTDTIINVGRFQADGPQIPHKRQDVLVDAFASMSDLIDAGWSLHLVGAVGPTTADREYFEDVRRQAAGLPIYLHPNASHELLNELSSRARFYWHAQGYGTDAVLHPEAQEHFGIATAEAMAAGIVPLVYATAGPAEIVQDEEELTWRTPDELVAKTRSLISSGRWHHWQKACLRRSDDFSTEAFARLVLEVLRTSVGPFPTDTRGQR